MYSNHEIILKVKQQINTHCGIRTQAGHRALELLRSPVSRIVALFPTYPNIAKNPQPGFRFPSLLCALAEIEVSKLLSLVFDSYPNINISTCTLSIQGNEGTII